MHAEYTVWCTQSFLPLFPQLVIIISHILPTVPPGEPKTTKNKGKTCLKKIQHFPLMQEPKLPLWDQLQMSWQCVCFANMKEIQIFRRDCLENKPHNTHREQVSSSSRVMSFSGLYSVCLPASACTTHHATYRWVPAKATLHFLMVTSESSVRYDSGTTQEQGGGECARLTLLCPADQHQFAADFLPSSSCELSWQWHRAACVTACIIKHKGHEWALTVMVCARKHRQSLTGRHCDGLILKVVPLQGKCHPTLQCMNPVANRFPSLIIRFTVK